MRSSLLRVPPPAPLQVAEHDDVAPVGQDELEVAPAERASGPPAVLHDPLLGDSLDGRPPEGDRRSRLAGADGGRARPAETAQSAHRPSSGSSTGYGASTARRSGRRESG